MALGNVIDVSFSLEASGELAADGEWASDTATPIVSYYLAGPELTAAPAEIEAGADAGSEVVSIQVDLDAPISWTTTITQGAQWLRVTSGSAGTGSGTVEVAWTENQDCDARTAVLRIASDEAENGSVEVTVTQAGGEPMALSVTPETHQVGADGGAATFDVESTGCGTLGWHVAVTQGAQWLHVTSGGAGTGIGTVEVACDENQDCDARTAVLRIASDEAENEYVEASVTQAGGAPMALSVTPATRQVSADGETATFDLVNTGCGALDWEAATAEDWLAIQGAASGVGDGTVTVVCDVNPLDAPRTGIVRITATGAANSPAEVTVVQEGCGHPVWDGVVHASDGGYADRVQLSWTAVPGAETYRVYRAEVDNSGSAVPVSDWLVATLYDDYAAAPPRAVSECLSSNKYVPYYYWVKCRNGCGGESGFSPGDRGYRGASVRQSAWCGRIEIDGEFEDWAEATSYSDPVDDQHATDDSGRYGTPVHVEHEDVDILEYKFTHDQENLYAYFRSRGVIGRTQTADQGRAGRYYVIVTIDVDNNDTTGYWLHEGGYYPTSSGYDMNMEVEFYDGAFNTGNYLNHGCMNEAEYLAALEDQAQGIVDVRPGTYDWYTQWVWRDEPEGISEEVRLPNGAAIIWVEDRGPVYQGILQIAVSADGHEAEMVAPFRGFMNYPSGEPIMALGNVIDVSFSLEASGELAADGDWASDTATPIDGYYLSRPTLSAAPSVLEMSSAPGSESLATEVSLDVPILWSAAVVQGGEWLRITAETTGVGSGMVDLAWDENTGCDLRTAIIRIASDEAENGYAEVTIAQAGSPAPDLSVTPDQLAAGGGGGALSFDVSNTGCGALNWQAATAEDWLAFDNGSAGTDDATVTVICDSNPSDAPRTGVIHVSATGASNSPAAITVVQEGCPAIAWAGLVSASDGAYADRVSVVWDPVDGAAGYRVYRNETDDPETAAPLGDWQTGTAYDDYDAGQPSSAVGCTGSTGTGTYFYWVKARNACGRETDFSPSDQGRRGGTVPAEKKAATVLPTHFPLPGSLGDAALMLACATLLLTRKSGHSH
jgi:hypothetical protein